MEVNLSIYLFTYNIYISIFLFNYGKITECELINSKTYVNYFFKKPTVYH